MGNYAKMQRLEESLQRIRERCNSLEQENKALKDALSDKDETIAQLERELDKREETWAQHITEVSEAIEEAAEAKLAYEQARDEVEVIRKDMRRFVNAMKKNI